MANPDDTPKGQHFLLSPECRTLTVLDLAKMRDTTAYNWFKRLRWHETEGEPYCPKCGTLRCHTMSRNRFKCSEKTCKAVFSITSGTVFHARKLSFKKTLHSFDAPFSPETRVVGMPFQVWWFLLPNAEIMR
ncbi:transposase [Pararhizobium sp. BT-229]|uniref:transposase n=1 Tax=Pararhizobium sp. BT-229 TaxID=2986923 RepID=UPI0021F6D526|nr:transposase [Pararhizobium sp. BT-229]MCV9965429.1 transposase [Pararhizobium sp. BT-229]